MNPHMNPHMNPCLGLSLTLRTDHVLLPVTYQ